MSDDPTDPGETPQDPRPSGRIRIVGAEPVTGEHPTVPPTDPESSAEPPPAEDPNTFGAIPVISADDPPPEDAAGPDPDPDDETRPPGVPDLDDLDLPTTASVPAVGPDPDDDDLDEATSPTASEDVDDIRVWAAPDDEEDELLDAGPSTSPDPYASLADPELGAEELATIESDLPHWSEPPTAQKGFSAEDEDDDLDAWTGVSEGPRWRGRGEERGQPDDFSDLSDERRVEPDLDEGGSAVGDDVVFDDLGTERPETAEPSGGPPQRRAPYPDAPVGEAGGGGGPRDMQQAVIVGMGLVGLMVVCFLIGPAATVVLATVIIVMASAEFFSATRRAGYQPATLVGLAGSGGMVLAAYWRGEAAIPLVMALVVVTTLAWWLLDLGGDHAVANAGITVLGVMYVGGLGSFAALLLKFPDGIGMLFGAILVAVAADVAGLFVGQRMGRSPLTAASPNKTVEGVIGGFIGAIVVSVVVLGLVGVFPWEFSDALALGAVGGLLTPLGDLCESRLKRDLGVKDMGELLPGHGGVLDRFDGLLFVLPATYYLVRVLEVWANTP
jgi:phosphatidate cytidylyltransferase